MLIFFLTFLGGVFLTPPRRRLGDPERQELGLGKRVYQSHAVGLIL